MDVKTYLNNKGIPFTSFSHSPVFTCEEAEKERAYEKIRGIHSKNLFLKERKSKRFYLVILPAEQKLDLKEIEKKTNDEIKFANEDDLKNILGLTKGSVSPFGLINDLEHKTIVLIDKRVWGSEYVSFHPNVNTETLELLGKDFKAYISSLGNKFELI